MILTHVYGNLFRGSAPKTKEDFALLRKNRISSIISLQGNILERLDDEVVDELTAFAGRLHWLPLSSVWTPRQGYVLQAIQLIREAKEPILVHCEQGVDRTGYVVAAYGMWERGFRYDEAKADVYANGFHWWYFYWLPSLKTWDR